MTNDEKLMAQALEALARFNYDHHWGSSQRPNWFENSITALRERLAQNREMDEAIAAGDGTLHGAIDYWQERALKAEARLAQKPEQAEPVQPNEVLFAVEIPEGYGDVHPELLGEDAFSGKGWVRWRVVPTDEPNAEPTRNAVISFLLGEAPLDGVWFDEPHPTYKGRFWWREYLLKATEPSAEPVAYRYRYIDGWRTNGGGPVNGVHPVECQPLYTAPPKRTPLTDEEINDEMDRLLLSPVEQEAFGSGVRYAERAHGIGEEK
jgi:hypothetical protein